MNIDQFMDQLQKSPRPVIIDFWAPWCLPCRAIKPSLDKLNMRYSGEVDLMRINADQNREILQHFNIMGIPTLLVFRNGEEVFRSTGAQSEGNLATLFELALNRDMKQISSLGIGERALRAGVGFLLLAFALSSGPSILLLSVAGLVLFSAVYDRCPVWQTVASKIKDLWFSRNKSNLQKS